ncbi:hypothetical protein EYF80_065171 [Liparis tanakae]|uniref:Uncharacterized protein n=1 Tax=Liparis tanakae TaxID=230148 RepID=A0A4Z2E7R2_9TELE|nr:hypothetical protein EYF80_065171 [Liparis tanakae]
MSLRKKGETGRGDDSDGAAEEEEEMKVRRFSLGPSNCGTSWMDTCRLNVFPLNSILLGSSSSRPPRLRSPTATS